MFNENNTTQLGVRQQRSHSPALIWTDTLKEFWVRFAPQNSITYMQIGANYHKWLPTAWRGKRGKKTRNMTSSRSVWLLSNTEQPSAPNALLTSPAKRQKARRRAFVTRGARGARKIQLRKVPGPEGPRRVCNSGTRGTERENEECVWKTNFSSVVSVEVFEKLWNGGCTNVAIALLSSRN